jgi:hypothetical protein
MHRGQALLGVLAGDMGWRTGTRRETRDLYPSNLLGTPLLEHKCTTPAGAESQTGEIAFSCAPFSEASSPKGEIN